MRLKAFLIVLFVGFSLLITNSVKAIGFTPPPFKDADYLGQYMSVSLQEPIELKTGETKEITVKIKNIGKATWENTGANFVSVYTVNPNYRQSIFTDSSWLSKSNPAKIKSRTLSGQTAEFTFKIKAPDKPGNYKEDFYLAAENKTWIKSSYFYLDLKVVAPTVPVVNVEQTTGLVTNFVFNKNLELGSTGEDVKQLQKYLNNKGFVVSVSGAGSMGNETTRFGFATKSALIKFQQANKISPAVGYFGPLTRKFINDEIATVQTKETTDITGNDTGYLPDEAQKVSKEYKTNLSAMTAYKVTAKGGEQIKFIVMYTNIGTLKWDNYLWQEAGSTAVSSSLNKINIADSSWLSPVKIYQGVTYVEPQQTIRVEFYFRAPKTKGEYTARFQLTANNHTLDGGTLEIPISVTENNPYYQEPEFTNNRVLVSEPNVKIGLYKALDEVKFKSDFSYEVFSGKEYKGVLYGAESVSLRYTGGNYYFNSPNLNFISVEKIRLVPYDLNHYFTLTNYSRLVSWKGNKNFNIYRGIMEFVYSPKTDIAWVVNELPMDLYIAGIGETSNGAAMEYIKAILVAARSYAYFHLYNGVSSDQRTFDLYATTVDQLYLGYNSEVLMPRVVQAARVTYGEMVTYEDKVIGTPYFGNSDGKTRTWKEVWGGTDKPWLIPVTCFYDQGKKLFGHGVGMSAWDASQRADKDGWTYEQLLKYYYTGVQVEKIY